jgi:Cu(I)/Ag(I) efflux system membrane fusion protein
VLDSGTRKLVYVEREPGIYEPRELVLGPRSGTWYPVLSGLDAGERVVTRGNFLIDSQFQLSGQASLFYPDGLHGDASHAHGGAR